MARISALTVLALAFVIAAPGTAPAASRKKEFYVSLGDSYATGHQPTGAGVGGGTRNGFADQLVPIARSRGYRLKLVNFGCGGETTTSILARKTACPFPAVGGPSYTGRTQAAAAARFLRRHRGEVALITVSIGGNDVTGCANAADAVACAIQAVNTIRKNVAKLVRRLRAVAGRKVRIVGTTYPDVLLGLWTTGKESDRNLARLSIYGFRVLINPALKQAYESVNRSRLVDVTAASGAYGSLEETTTLAPYGVIPVPVAKVCELTYYCDLRDVHARTSGYRLIAELIAATLPRR
jgi:lysophospholipase L1-like esterase